MGRLIRSSYQRAKSICRQRELQNGMAGDEFSSKVFPQVGQRAIVRLAVRGNEPEGYLSDFGAGLASLAFDSGLDSLLAALFDSPLESLLEPPSLALPSAAAFFL